MLELQHLPMRGLHICKMPLPVLGTVETLPAHSFGNRSLPFAVPFGLWLPVVIEVSPVGGTSAAL